MPAAQKQGLNGWITQDGRFLRCPPGQHYNYLTRVLKQTDRRAQETAKEWVSVRPWNCGQDSVLPYAHLARRYAGGFSSTGRGKYTDAQLSFMLKHDVFIDKTKL